MAKYVCEMCGCEDVSKENGGYVCPVCGYKSVPDINNGNDEAQTEAERLRRERQEEIKRITTENRKKKINFGIVLAAILICVIVAVTTIVTKINMAHAPLEVFAGVELGDSVSSYPRINEYGWEKGTPGIINEVHGYLYADTSDDKIIDSLYWVSSNMNGNKQEIVDTAQERIIEHLTKQYGNGKEVTVPEGVIPYSKGPQRATQFVTKSGLVYLVSQDRTNNLTRENVYIVQVKKPY